MQKNKVYTTEFKTMKNENIWYSETVRRFQLNEHTKNGICTIER